MSTINEIVSRNVRALRIARGWTQEEAGRRFGELTGAPWSNAVWSAAESQTRPRDWTAAEIASLSRLFIVPLDDLFASESSVPTCPTCGQEVSRLPAAAEPAAEGASVPTPNRKRHRITREHLAKVADVYAVALAEGEPPTRAVADHFEVPHSTAAKWVTRTREIGLLAATTPGRSAS